MKEPLRLTEHAIVFQWQPGVFVLYQVLLRKGVAVDAGTFSSLISFLAGSQSEGETGARFGDMSCFSLQDCLFDNPACIRPSGQAVKLSGGSLDALIKLLKEYSIIFSDEPYVNRLGKRAGFSDRSRLGNFHQQLGEYLVTHCGGKAEADEWWIHQRFERDLSGPRGNLFRWVQQEFLESYFRDLTDGRLLDFGCGIGYYSAFFAKKGLQVLGVDPNPLYIKIAQDHFASSGKTEYQVRSFEKEDDLQFLEGQSFDHIFLCDVFLYYFEPYKPMTLTPAGLLSRLKKALSPGGRIYICDPHGCFHLHAWMGKSPAYLISTEYKHRKFRVTPTLEEFSLAVEAAGMKIRKIRECYCKEGLQDPGQNAAVAAEFPLWWFFEIGA